jgi:hypothetical protein
VALAELREDSCPGWGQVHTITRAGTFAHIHRAKAGEIGSIEIGRYEFADLPTPVIP